MPPFYENKQSRFECFLSKDITFPAHLHDAVEIIFIKEGELHVTVQNHSRILKKHDVALAFPNLIHSYSCATPALPSYAFLHPPTQRNTITCSTATNQSPRFLMRELISRHMKRIFPSPLSGCFCTRQAPPPQPRLPGLT